MYTILLAKLSLWLVVLISCLCLLIVGGSQPGGDAKIIYQLPSADTTYAGSLFLFVTLIVYANSLTAQFESLPAVLALVKVPFLAPHIHAKPIYALQWFPAFNTSIICVFAKLQAFLYDRVALSSFPHSETLIAK